MVSTVAHPRDIRQDYRWSQIPIFPSMPLPDHPSPDFFIRCAVLADAEAIAAIYNEAVLNSVATFDTEIKSVEDRREWLRGHEGRHPVIVAEADGAVVGWASLSLWSDRRAYDGTAETSFYVLESHQGRGIGRRLLNEIVSAGRRCGFHTLAARIAEGSEASIRLHAAEGFVAVGILREVGRKFDRFLDVHIMQLMLRELGLISPMPAAGQAGREFFC